MVGKTHPISKEKWNQAKEYNQEKDNATKIFGEKPTPEQIMQKSKRIIYQRKRNTIPTMSDQHLPKAMIPPSSNLNIELGNWLSNAKILVPVIEIL